MASSAPPPSIPHLHHCTAIRPTRTIQVVYHLIASNTVDPHFLPPKIINGARVELAGDPNDITHPCLPLQIVIAHWRCCGIHFLSSRCAPPTWGEVQREPQFRWINILPQFPPSLHFPSTLYFCRSKRDSTAPSSPRPSSEIASDCLVRPSFPLLRLFATLLHTLSFASTARTSGARTALHSLVDWISPQRKQANKHTALSLQENATKALNNRPK